MDNQLIIFWSISTVGAVFIDIVAYFLLRNQWKQRGFTVVDEFWEKVFRRVDQTVKAVQARVPALPTWTVWTASPPDPTTPEPVPVAPGPLPASTLTEPPALPPPPAEPAPQLIPAAVKKVGKLKRVEFSLDVPLDSAVNLRIGPSTEKGVNVEKRDF